MKTLIKIVLVFFVYICCFPAPQAHAKKFEHALFLVPDEETPFWLLFTSIMRAAADDLGVELEVINIKDRIAFVQEAKKAVDAVLKPDVVFFNLSAGLGFDKKVLEAFVGSGIKVFIINSGFSEEDMETVVGLPRAKYECWIAQMTPYDLKAGYDVAETLMGHAQSRPNHEDSRVYFNGVNGSIGSRPSEERTQGLKEFVASRIDAQLDTVSSGYWRVDTARYAAEEILDMYPRTDVIWAVSDLVAIGAVEAIEKNGKVPGQDVFVASVDWLPDIIPYIKDGRVAASYGGHFVEGAWGMILAYDYMNGHDFSETIGTVIRTPMQMMDINNVDMIGNRIVSTDWEGIDFKALTKTHNPHFKSYDFDVLSLIQAGQ